MLIRRDKNAKLPIRKVIRQDEKHYLIVIIGLIVSTICAFYCYSLIPLAINGFRSDLDYQRNIAKEEKFIELRVSKKELTKFKNIYFGFDRGIIHKAFTIRDAVKFEFLSVKLEMSWRHIEYLLMTFYLLFFFCFAIGFSKWLKFFRVAISDHVFSVFEKMCPKIIQIWLQPFIKVIDLLFVNKKFYWVLFFVGILGFLIFNGTRISLIHYGVRSDVLEFYKFFSEIVSGVTVALVFLPLVKNQESVDGESLGRRFTILRLASILVVSFLPVVMLEKGGQAIKLGLIPDPRFRKKRPASWQATSLMPGLYQHTKSKHFFYVNELKQLRSGNKVNIRNLRIISSIDESDFRYISRMTANVYFEELALHRISKGKVLDALDLLELGCKYEVFSLLKNKNLKPNIRLFKLYFGLCHQKKLKHHHLNIKTLVNHEKLKSVLQPPPQKWMRSKAWCFKNRWSLREKYNNQKLTVTT